MDTRLKDALPKELDKMHHAHLLIGDPDKALEQLKAFLEDIKYPILRNPDFYDGVHQVFTIDDARALKDIAYLKPVNNTHRVFCISAWSIVDEAQNALLKLFEEPSETARFFILVPRRDILVTPLLSRLSDLGDNLFENSKSKISIASFLGASVSERIKILEKILDSKNKSEAESFIRELEKFYYKKQKAGLLDANVFEDLWKATKMLNSNKVSDKLVLENLALTLPTV